MSRVIEVHESAFAGNDQIAATLRAQLAANGVTMLNVMSSPGSGKTTLLSALIPRLKERIRVAVMDVDIATSLDADRVENATGVRCLQIHNGGLCHIDAQMTKTCIDTFGVEDTDLLILENIGNLVCPAEFDTGAHYNIMLLSVPEGDDKPLKYPLMFKVCDLVLITKIDTMPVFNFDLQRCRERIARLNPHARVLCVSAITGQGMDELEQTIEQMMQKEKNEHA